MQGRRSQREELIPKNPEIGARQRRNRNISDTNREENQCQERMSEEEFLSRFLAMENQLTQLMAIMTQQQQQPRQDDRQSTEERTNRRSTREDEASTSTPSLPFKVEAKVEIPTFAGEVNAEKFNNWFR